MYLKYNKGFTLIELLVVIAIIGLLASITLVSLKSAIAKARDGRRLSEINQIVKALEVYYSTYNQYPGNTDNDCSGWDAGYMEGDPFIKPLVDSGITNIVPIDPVSKPGNPCGWGYHYYRYGAGSYGCDASRGAYFVLGVRDMETSGRPHPDSLGWSCPGRNWQSEFDWVIGGFEK